MLSSRLTDSIRASENKLLKKEKKKLAKITFEDVDVESCAPSDVNSDDKVNKYINIVNKKLRTLRKRMNKIEKYENSNKKELNADQITAIKKKPEVSALIKEFEDLHKQYTVFDEQEKKEEETNKKLQEERLVKEINEKVEDEKKLYSSQLQYLFNASYALNIVINTRKFTFSNAELNALNYVRNSLLGANGVIDNKYEGEILLKKLYDESIDECCDGVTFKDVNNLINLILNPPQVSKKDSSQGLSFFSQDIHIDYNEQQIQPHQQIVFSSELQEEMPQNVMNEASISMSKINFLQPNELIEEVNENIAEEVKQEIIPDEKQEINAKISTEEVSNTETVGLSENNDAEITESNTEETPASVIEEKETSDQLKQKGHQNNQFQKKRGYYKGGRGRRNYQNGQYNNRHGNSNGGGYKGSRNNGYYPHQNQNQNQNQNQKQNQNQNHVSYYYNNRSATF